MGKESNISRFLVQKNATGLDTTQKIAALFCRGKRSFRNQEEIRTEYYKRYNTTISQGAVSKALKKLKHGFMYSNDNKKYYISRRTRTNGSGYFCTNKNQAREDKRFQIVSQKLFKSETVWILKGTPEAYVFWVKEGKMNTVKKEMTDLLGPEVLDIFDYQDKLVIVLMPNTNPNVKDFFNLEMEL